MDPRARSETLYLALVLLAVTLGLARSAGGGVLGPDPADPRPPRPVIQLLAGG